MDIVKTATEWSKDELFSSLFFILFGIMFVVGSIGFWQLGKTDVAKSFIYPMLIAGALLLTAGIGFFFGNKSRLTNIETEYKANPSAFVQSEIERTEKTMGEYQNIAFKVFPLIIAVAALLMVFVNSPTWRAISIVTIATLLMLSLIHI